VIDYIHDINYAVIIGVTGNVAATDITDAVTITVLLTGIVIKPAVVIAVFRLSAGTGIISDNTAVIAVIGDAVVIGISLSEDKR